MVASDAIANQSAGLRRGGLEAVAREHVDQLCVLCRRFMCREREEILKKDPSPKEREEHQRTLKWLLQAASLDFRVRRSTNTG